MIKKIRKIFFVILLVFTPLILVFSQTSGNLKSFIGYWTTNGSMTRTVIFVDKDNQYQMVIWDSSDGEDIKIVNIQVKGSTIKTTEKTNSTNWVTYNTYSIIDENKLKYKVEGDGNTTIYLKRLK